VSFDLEALARADGVRPARQARSEATLERLLDAAEDLFAAQGVDGTSMAAVAAAGRSSIGSLYTRFPDKTALVRAVQLRLVRRLFGSVADALGEDDPASVQPAAEVVGALVSTLARGLLAQAGLLRAIIVCGVSDPVMRERIGLTLDDATRRLAERLRSCDDIAHPDPEIAADLIVRMVTGALQQLVVLDRPMDGDQLVAELTAAACAYLQRR
jgi:AcrR family transcriptional regulator